VRRVVVFVRGLVCYLNCPANVYYISGTLGVSALAYVPALGLGLLIRQRQFVFLGSLKDRRQLSIRIRIFMILHLVLVKCSLYFLRLFIGYSARTLLFNEGTIATPFI